MSTNVDTEELTFKFDYTKMKQDLTNLQVYLEKLNIYLKKKKEKHDAQPSKRSSRDNDSDSTVSGDIL
jgi:hypothetical protein